MPPANVIIEARDMRWEARIGQGELIIKQSFLSGGHIWTQAPLTAQSARELAEMLVAYADLEGVR